MMFCSVCHQLLPIDELVREVEHNDLYPDDNRQPVCDACTLAVTAKTVLEVLGLCQVTEETNQ